MFTCSSLRARYWCFQYPLSLLGELSELEGELGGSEVLLVEGNRCGEELPWRDWALREEVRDRDMEVEVGNFKKVCWIQFIYICSRIWKKIQIIDNSVTSTTIVPLLPEQLVSWLGVVPDLSNIIYLLRLFCSLHLFPSSYAILSLQELPKKFVAQTPGGLKIHQKKCEAFLEHQAEMRKNRRANVALEERRKKALVQLAKKVDSVSMILCIVFSDRKSVV